MNKINRLSGLWLWLIALLLMSLESAFAGVSAHGDLLFHTPIGISVYLGLCRRFEMGSLLFALCIPVFESLAGGPLGMYTLGAAIVFIASQLIKTRMGQYWGIGHGLFGLAAFVVLYTFWTMLLISFYGDTLQVAFFIQMGGDILRFSVMIWPLGYFLSYLDEKWGEPVFQD